MRRHRSVGLYLAILLGLGLVAPAARAQEELFVTNGDNAIRVYARYAGGDAAPLRTIAGGSTQLSNPQGIVVDRVHDEILVANSPSFPTPAYVTVYSRTANGDVGPLRVIGGPATTLISSLGIALDLVNDEIVVSNNLIQTIVVFARTANGNVAPLRQISGAGSGVNVPSGIAIDTVHDEIAVANSYGFNTSTITFYARTASGNVPPLRTIGGGPNAALWNPIGLALDLVHDEVSVMNLSTSTISIFARTADGDVAPLRAITDTFDYPRGLTVDPLHDELLVANSGASA